MCIVVYRLIYIHSTRYVCNNITYQHESLYYNNMHRIAATRYIVLSRSLRALMISRKRRRESAPLLSTCSRLSSSAISKSASSSAVSRDREDGGRRFSFENWLLSHKKKRRSRCSGDWNECCPSSPKLCDTGEDVKLSAFVRWCGMEGIKFSRKVICT